MERILENLHIKKGETIIVGVSGGADSMVLLSALILAQKNKEFNLVAVHVNHNIRKGESLRDQKFVENYCTKNNVKLQIYNVDCLKIQEKTKDSIEEVARILRYDCFNRELEKYKNARIALAHHKNDNAETIFMNLGRGAGIFGALGIKESDKIIRPLLNLSKQEILEIAKKNKIDFVTDSTNNDLFYTRNYIRNNIFPQIEKVFSMFQNNLISFANFLKEDNEYFESILPKESVTIKENSIEIEKQALLGARPISVRLLKYALDKKGWSKDFYKEHYNKILELATLKNGAKIDLPHKKEAFSEYDKIVITNKIEEKNKEVADFKIGNINILNYEIKIEKSSLNSVSFDSDDKFLDLDKIPQNTVIRTRKNGDMFRKLGSGNKKLNDYFTDKKIPIRKRDEILLLASGNNILMVFGYDISENIKIDDKTENVIKISVKSK